MISIQSLFIVSLGEFSNHLPTSSIKSSTLSRQTAWTGFDPYLYGGGSSSVGSVQVEITTVKCFILNRD